MQLNDVVQKTKAKYASCFRSNWAYLLPVIYLIGKHFNLLFEIHEINANIKWPFYILGGMIKKGLASEHSEPLHVFWLEFTKE